MRQIKYMEEKKMKKNCIYDTCRTHHVVKVMQTTVVTRLLLVAFGVFLTQRTRDLFHTYMCTRSVMHKVHVSASQSSLCYYEAILKLQY